MDDMDDMGDMDDMDGLTVTWYSDRFVLGGLMSGSCWCSRSRGIPVFRDSLIVGSLIDMILHMIL